MGTCNHKQVIQASLKIRLCPFILLGGRGHRESNVCFSRTQDPAMSRTQTLRPVQSNTLTVNQLRLS